MDIYVYDEFFTRLKIIDVYESLYWFNEFNDTGEFKLVCSLKYFDILKADNIIMVSEDKDNAGIIEYIEVKRDYSDNTSSLEVKGRMLESLLDRRIMLKGVYSNSIEPAEFINRAVTRNAISPEDVNRKISRLKMGTMPSSDYGPIAYEAVYSDLLDVVKRVNNMAGFGFNISPDINTKQFILNVIKGTNRTSGQTTNKQIILNKSFDNVLTTEYSKEMKKYKTLVYIKGEGEFKTELALNYTSGIERREMFIDCSNIKQKAMENDVEIVIPDADYALILQNEAKDKLKKASINEILNNTLNLRSNYKYKRDFFIGDLITCSDSELNFSVDLRITGVEETWNENGYNISLKLGEDTINFSNAVKEIVDQKTNNSKDFTDEVLSLQETKANKTEIPTSLPANGGNADTLGGYSKNLFAVSKIITAAEANNAMLSPGLYNVEGEVLANLPSSYTQLIVGKHSPDIGYGTQIAIPYVNGLMQGVWYRVATGTTYPNFEKIGDYSKVIERKEIVSLPFADGFVDCIDFGQRTRYTKDAMGLVKIDAICKFSNTQKITWAEGKMVVDMPVGFKGFKHTYGFGTVLLNGNTVQTQSIAVEVTSLGGKIYLGSFDYIGTNHILKFHVEYYAEG